VAERFLSLWSRWGLQREALEISASVAELGVGIRELGDEQLLAPAEQAERG
jgi:hypothetical protein